MNRPSRVSRRSGLTLIELLVVVSLLLGLLWILLPGLLRPRRHSGHSRMSCVNNLKQIGIAFRTYAVDFNGAYPWQKSGSDTNHPGGPLPSVSDTNLVSADLLGYFAMASNELATPKILSCPTDNRRRPPTNTWSHLLTEPAIGHTIPSYFLGLGAAEEIPESLLAGDRNVTNDPAHGPSWRDVGMKSPAWVPRREPQSYRSLGYDPSTMHKGAGNILMGDGSVQQVSRSRLQSAASASSEATPTVWLFPVDH